MLEWYGVSFKCGVGVNLGISLAIYTRSASHRSSMFTYRGISAQISANRLKADGVGSFEQALHFQNQDFEALKQECLEGGYLFEDPCFPAEPPSLGFKELAPHSSKTRDVEWMRPTVRKMLRY